MPNTINSPQSYREHTVPLNTLLPFRAPAHSSQHLVSSFFLCILQKLVVAGCVFLQNQSFPVKYEARGLCHSLWKCKCVLKMTKEGKGA